MLVELELETGFVADEGEEVSAWYRKRTLRNVSEAIPAGEVRAAILLLLCRFCSLVYKQRT